MNASGCGVTVREYGHMLQATTRPTPPRRERISALTRDLSELLPELVPALKGRVSAPRRRLAYHPPCTLQHGQKLRGGVETNLRALGFDVQVALNESHLCCGSAGTYSVLQPELAYPLRDRKLGHLNQLRPHDHRVGQHRLHHAPAKRQRDARAALGRGAGRGTWRRHRRPDRTRTGVLVRLADRRCGT